MCELPRGRPGLTCRITSWHLFHLFPDNNHPARVVRIIKRKSCDSQLSHHTSAWRASTCKHLICASRRWCFQFCSQGGFGSLVLIRCRRWWKIQYRITCRQGCKLAGVRMGGVGGVRETNVFSGIWEWALTGKKLNLLCFPAIISDLNHFISSAPKLCLNYALET